MNVPPYGGTTDRHPAPETQTAEWAGFGAPSGAAHIDSQAFGKPPLGWLLAAGAVAVAALAVALILGTGIGFAGAAWFAAGPVAIGLLAVYANRDTVQRARAVYDELPQARLGYWAVAVVAMVGTLTSAWQIAQWVGRL